MTDTTDQTTAPADAGGAQVTEEEIADLRDVVVPSASGAAEDNDWALLYERDVPRLLGAIAAVREEARIEEDRANRHVLLVATMVGERDDAREEARHSHAVVEDASRRILEIQRERDQAREEARGWEETAGRLSDVNGNLLDQLETAREEARILRAHLQEAVERQEWAQDSQIEMKHARDQARAAMATAAFERDVAREEARDAKEHILKLEDIVVTWGVDCEHCAQYLDSGLAETFRAEKAEKERDAVTARAAGLEDLREMAWGHATALYTLACEILTALEALDTEYAMHRDEGTMHDSQVYAWRKLLDEHAP